MLILRDCMSSPVISVPGNTTVQEAAQIMADKGISCIFVQDREEYSRHLHCHRSDEAGGREGIGPENHDHTFGGHFPHFNN